MVLLNGVKFACETCIKGHRTTTCKHTDRQLVEIKKKGRPQTQCDHCRELRKVKQMHVKCLCAAAKPDIIPPVATELVSSNRIILPNCSEGPECPCCVPRKRTSIKRSKQSSLQDDRYPDRTHDSPLNHYSMSNGQSHSYTPYERAYQLHHHPPVQNQQWSTGPDPMFANIPPQPSSSLSESWPTADPFPADFFSIDPSTHESFLPPADVIDTFMQQLFADNTDVSSFPSSISGPSQPGTEPNSNLTAPWLGGEPNWLFSSTAATITTEI